MKVLKAAVEWKKKRLAQREAQLMEELAAYENGNSDNPNSPGQNLNQLVLPEETNEENNIHMQTASGSTTSMAT